MTIKVCKRCGGNFQALTRRKKWCSVNCKNLGNKNIKRGRAVDSFVVVVGSVRPEVVKRDVVCAKCGGEFPSYLKNAKFCSKRCSKSWFNKVRKLAQRGRKIRGIAKRCAVCGEDRVVDRCHIVPAAAGGELKPDNVIIMCPTHHRLFDGPGLSVDELRRLGVGFLYA